MDNTSSGVNTVQNSPVVQNVVSTNPSDAKIEASLAAGNIADAFKEFVADSTATTDAEATSENMATESANSVETDLVDASAQDVDAQPQKEKLPQGIKKRIAVLNARNDKLTTEYKAVLEQREAAVEANKILQKELERLMSKANLSDAEEDAVIDQLGRTMSQLDVEIPDRVAAKMAEVDELGTVAEQQADIDELADRISVAHESYKNLFTLRELGKFMQINELTDPEQAARLLGEHKAQRQRKQAPLTAGIAGAGAKQTVKRWGYTGSDSIRDFFAQDARERTGRK